LATARRENGGRAAKSSIVIAGLEDFDLPVYYLHFWMVVLDPAHSLLNYCVSPAGVVSHCDKGYLGGLPDIVVTHFGGRQVELTSQACQNRLEKATFSFQGTVAGEKQLDATGTDDHNLMCGE
jgi:hypothetical protein